MNKAVVSIGAVLASVCLALTGAAADFSGLWVGTWSSIDSTSGWIKTSLSQSATTLTGTFDVETANFGEIYDIPCRGSLSGSTATITMTLIEDGSTYQFRYTQAQLSPDGQTMSGNYTITEDGAAWDSGTFVMEKTIPPPKLTVTGGLINGEFASEFVPPGEARQIVANGPVTGKVFAKWTVTPATASLGGDFQINEAETTVVMPSVNVTLTATYIAIPKLTVNGGGIEGEESNVAFVLPGEERQVSANAAAAGKVFSKWTVSPATAILGGAFHINEAETTVVMPLAGVTLTATYIAIPKLTVNGGGIEGEASNVAFVLPGEERQIFANEVEGKVFEKWTVSPAAANVGGLFNPREANVTVVMPLVGVTLTAVYVTAPGFITVQVSGNIQDVELGGIFWSVDNVAWVPVNDGNAYPFKPGTVTVSFKSSSPSWLAPAKQTVKVLFDQTADVNAVATYVPVVAWQLSADSLPGSGTVTLSPANGQVLPGKSVTLTAKPAANYVFVGWSGLGDAAAGAERSPTLAVSPERDAVYTARFRAKSDCELPEISLGAATECMVGVAYSAVVSVNDGALPVKFTAAVLPAGLKIDPVTGAISGVPTKAGTFSVTFNASGAGGAASPQVCVFHVAALPLWAQGAFSGWAYLRLFAPGMADTAVSFPGTASMSVSAVGKVTGKVTCGGTNYVFTAASYAPAEAGFDSLSFTAEAKAGKVSLPLNFSVLQTAPESETLATLGWAGGMYLGECASCDVYMDRNAWKDPGMAAVVTNYTGYYTATLPGGEGYGSGYLAFTVDKTGGVKTTGKLADGAAVSLSGTLGMDGGGTVITVVYVAPAAYKGGSFFGLVEFARPEEGGPVIVRMLDDGDIQGVFLWDNYNPAATEEYGLKFSRMADLYGGWYNTVINLRDYYANGLVVGGVELPPLTAAVKYTDWDWESQREPPPKITWTETGVFGAAEGASPNGLVLGVTPATGVGTGLAAPRADTPVRDAETGEYDYTADTTGDGVANSSGLTFTFTRATGLFKGSFKTWYDYVSADDRTTERLTLMHAQKIVAYEGALTPVREAGEAEGRGFFLWADKSSFDSGKVDTYGNPIMTPYSFNRSYDFLLLGN